METLIMRKILLLAAAGVMAAVLAACGGGEGNIGGDPPQGVRAAVATADGSMKETLLTADPRQAVDAIFQSLDNCSVNEVPEDQLDDVFGLAPYMIIDAVAYVSDVKSGLCDVAVVEPAPGMTDSVREALNQYKILRAESFKNYDILNAYSIASNAAVFNQGDYVVMLMLPDNEAAREIMDQFMPK